MRDCYSKPATLATEYCEQIVSDSQARSLIKSPVFNLRGSPGEFCALHLGCRDSQNIILNKLHADLRCRFV